MSERPSSRRRPASRSAGERTKQKYAVGDVDPGTGRPRTPSPAKSDRKTTDTSAEPSSEASVSYGGADAWLRRIPLIGRAYEAIVDSSPGLAKGTLVAFTIGLGLVFTVTTQRIAQLAADLFGVTTATAWASQALILVAPAAAVMLNKAWARMWRPFALLGLTLITQPGALGLVLIAGYSRIFFVELRHASVWAAAAAEPQQPSKRHRS